MNKTKTLQDFFSMAFIGLRNQGFKRSMTSSGCAYRGSNGLKCAIGHCIPDEKYTPKMEFLTVGDIEILDAIGASEKIEPDLCFLQWIHDSGKSPEMMKKDLHAFAKRCKLEVPA